MRTMKKQAKGLFGKRTSLAFITVLLLSVAIGCSSTGNSESQQESSKQPILIQGPMPIEAEKLADKLENVKKEKSSIYEFYIGTVNDYPVIVSKTSKGMENTAAATAIAVEKYNPIAIINQGTSGGHDPDLHVFDIVLGKRSVNIGSLKTGNRAENEGIDPTAWIPMDLMASEGSAGEDPDAENIRYYKGDKDLLQAAKAVKDKHTKGQVVEGTIGSADVWNNEVDRINWFHEKYGTSVEEMETASAAQIAKGYDVPFLGIRILSNNTVNGGEYNPNTATANQKYVYEVVKQYISTLPNE